MPPIKTGNITKKENDLFDIEDHVKYEDLIEDKLPDHLIFPEQLNTYLRDRIRDLTAENGCLRRALEEVEEKLQNLRKLSAQDIPVTVGRASETAAAKIIELSKKCREQTAEIEVLKTKCKSLEARVANKEAELEHEKMKKKGMSQRTTSALNESISFEDQLRDREEQMKQLNEKLQQVNAKLYESKNTCTSLKQELNKAQKLLCSEVGENVTVTGLINYPGGWRGRAEQVQQLQQKLTELQCKLSEYEGTSKGSTVSIEQRNLANLRNMEKERRQQIENSAKELRQAEVALETSKRKQDAARARIKVLENELNTAKRSIILLNEKRNHDDQLIEALNNQLKAIEGRFQDRESLLQKQYDKSEQECVRLTTEIKTVQLTVEQLQQRLQEREVEIDSLKGSTGCTNKKWSPKQNQNIYESPLSTSRNLKDPNEYVTLSIAAEAERERLLELVIILNRRLDNERAETDHLSETLRQERNKCAKLETKVQKFEMERVGMSKVNTGYKIRSSKIAKASSNENQSNEEMRFKLELLQEECLALKARLATIQQDKAADLITYKQMLDQARKTFQDAYREKPSTSGCHSTMTI
ncbi:coiled-coil domain-containing protein 13 isoform X1 [Cephus cinctus]|uniref:Coiled-coil domain-containing protein 13 isoform X1 n=1 Tax=Cephus cinctus TaxID=211228 RepID=A0AAJ7R7P2_CEPCN|nr:coiled-coil domain-containing protein 13 isoform X1 [Cephus cinctus]XP_024935797.1 coiled-coil domain-containing protein 13 isoform X1 [Cephus cinctus]XP_024935798.1 coiled-coil domain-containing protein 13 isoform X1 [Cephus cinctus]